MGRYTYDAVSNRTSVKTPNGVTEGYTFDALNRVLSAVNKKGNDVISSFTNVYDPAGMIKSKTFDEGAFMTYGYDALNRLTKETKKAQNGAVIYDHSYTYDPLGNRLSWNKSMGLGDFFEGDDCKRFPKLLFEMERTGLRNFNRVRPLVVSLIKSYQYDPNNRLTEWNYALKVNNLTFPIEKTTYTYDRNGNRISKEKVKRWQEGNPQQTGYTYDLENRLVKLQYVNIFKGPQQDVLSYSGDGLRTKAIRNTDTTAYLYDGSNVLIERDASNTTTKLYTRGLDFGGGINSLISQNTPSSHRNKDKDTLYYQYNDLGSVANLTTSKGKAAQEYQYDAFGNLLDDRDDRGDRDDDDIANNYLFSTKEFDQRAGLYYFGARYYDPEVGRWLTPDPLGYADGLNLYAYVNNNPVNFVDPYGLSKETLGNEGDRQGAVAVVSSSSNKHSRESTQWGPPWVQVFIPGYGWYGGPARTDLTFEMPPEDSMDEAFKQHDKGWMEGNSKAADEQLYQQLYSLDNDPSRWPSPAKNNFVARVYHWAAEEYFGWAHARRNENE